MQLSPLAASRREETEAAHQSVTISTTLIMTSRCLNNITVSGNGQSVMAMVVDDVMTNMIISHHCPNNIVDASKAVWKALGVPEGDWGELDIISLGLIMLNSINCMICSF
ncbi:hypothetical protein C2S51_002721 [Perilla frutescens var. frutescens]|nr:hypothetical protein C2S51_002721 [Perilla frutescens var. frutescens]